MAYKIQKSWGWIPLHYFNAENLKSFWGFRIFMENCIVLGRWLFLTNVFVFFQRGLCMSKLSIPKRKPCGVSQQVSADLRNRYLLWKMVVKNWWVQLKDNEKQSHTMPPHWCSLEPCDFEVITACYHYHGCIMKWINNLSYFSIQGCLKLGAIQVFRCLTCWFQMIWALQNCWNILFFFLAWRASDAGK